MGLRFDRSRVNPHVRSQAHANAPWHARRVTSLSRCAAHPARLGLRSSCAPSRAERLSCVHLQDQEYYDRIPEPSDDENDLLDLAFGLTDT